MSNAVYPAAIAGLAFTVLKQRSHPGGITQSSPGQDEVRILQTYNPIWHFTLMYEVIFGAWPGSGNVQAFAPYTDIQYLMGFTMARGGTFDDFLFDDPSDDSVGPAMTSASPPEPNTQAELQLVNDGGSPPIYYSPIQRNMGGLFYEDITDLNGSIAVYANGILQSSGYSVLGPGLAIPGYSFRGLYLQWSHQPTPPITASFKFYFRVRFEEDTTDFEQWAQELWTIGGENARNGSGQLKLISARPAAA
jgi:Conserved hypothetical protein 2217 (DUF2460)